MQVKCKNCDHVDHVPEDEIASTEVWELRCSNCGMVGDMKCTHSSVHNDACDWCGKTFD